MARFRVLIKPSAVKELESIPRKRDRQQIVRRIEKLADDPRPRGCQKLAGQNRYRIRKGIYRIIYEIDNEELLVYVVKLGHRKDVYRGT